MPQESSIDIERSPQSTVMGKEEVEMTQKGQCGTEDELQVGAAWNGKRSRFRMIATVTALFVRLSFSLLIVSFR
jgi:hypothetical protein